LTDTMKKTTANSIVLLFLCLAACKKDKPAGPGSPQGSRLELSLDSLYLYAKETYLWYQQLPEYAAFSPRQYAAANGDGLASLTTELRAITAYAINPQTKSTYEFREGHPNPLYSFIAHGNVITGEQAVVDIDGQGDDLGMGLGIVNDTAVFVSYVERGSPAAEAGIGRGMQLTHVNGDPVQVDATAINNLLGSPLLTLRFQSQDGNTIEKTLASQTYHASPVLASSLIETETGTVGYVALARFSKLSLARDELDVVFARFAGNRTTKLVIDLRYNAGGYVQTAEYIADLIAPAAINGAVMYSEHFNDLLQQGRAPILQAVPYLDENRQPVYVNGRKATYADVDYSVSGNTYRFSKKGSLSGIKSIVFIVSGRTASASELLINCFKPYIDVKLVGSTTYGKPVGFFGIGIGAYTAYLSQFHILNAAGQGDYYEGMPCDMPATDDIRYNFGDTGEGCLAQSLTYLRNTGRQSGGETILRRTAPRVLTIDASPVKKRRFAGMVEQRLRLK
jgi:hypothetical protein